MSFDYDEIFSFCEQNDIRMTVLPDGIKLEKVKEAAVIPVELATKLSTDSLKSYIIKNLLKDGNCKYEVRLHDICQGCPDFVQGNSNSQLDEYDNYILYGGGKPVTKVNTIENFKIFSCVHYDICKRAMRKGNLEK